MPVRKADARWEGDLRSGKGQMRFGSGAFEGAYSFTSRFEEGEGTNPEELIAAAHAGCYSMALSGALGRAGHEPKAIDTNARVHLDRDDSGFYISKIELTSVAEVPGIDDAAFQDIAEQTKAACPVSKLLAAAEITLEATLKA